MITRTAQLFENKAMASISFNSETLYMNVGLSVANTGSSDAKKINFPNIYQPIKHSELFDRIFEGEVNISLYLVVARQR